jgi:hypothetical protein
MKRIGLMLFCLTMIGTPGLPAFAAEGDQPSAGEMAADLVVARPFGVAITAVGAAVFLVSLPFTAVAGGIGHAADELVKKPAQETFMRCLGCKVSGRYQAPR